MPTSATFLLRHIIQTVSRLFILRAFLSKMGRLGMLGKGGADGGADGSAGGTTTVAGGALWKRKLAEMRNSDAARKVFKTTVHSLLVRGRDTAAAVRQRLRAARAAASQPGRAARERCRYRCCSAQ
jgi:hypothetical protein